MPQSTRSPARGEGLLISRPAAEKRALFTFVPGTNLLLDFEISEATISRNQDSLVFSLKDGASVAITNFFADHHTPPSLALPDGTRISAGDFFIGSGSKPGAAATPASAENGESDDVGKLENLFEDVSRVGGLGTLYWGQAPGVTKGEGDPSAPKSELSTSPLQVSAAQFAGLAGSDRLEDRPGYHRPGQDEHREDLQLPGSDGGRDGTCPTDGCQESGGGERPGPMFSSGGHDPFGSRGFNLEAFVRDNTPLQEWTLNADGFSCVTDETFVAGNAVAPKIAIAWSMTFDASKGQAALSDVTFALLFKVGLDGQLIYVDHKVVEFGGVDENGTPLTASGSVSWSVAAGEHYVTSLVVAGTGQDSGTVLVVDGMEYHIGQTEPAWHGPVYDDPAAALVAGSVFGGAHGSDGALSGAHPPADEPAAHASGESESFVTRFFLNGEWHAADDQAVRWMDEDGACYAFRLDGHGKYILETEGASTLSLHAGPDLHVVYETQSKDGTETQATLSIAIPGHAPNGHDAELSVASADGDSGTAPAGGESWHDVAFAEGIFSSELHFSLSGNDRSSFEDLLGERETLDHLLESGRIALSGQGDAFRLDISTESGQELHLDVSFQEDQLASFSAGYAEKHGSSEGLEQALLQMMLFGA